jgi:hypothetical protein
LTLQDFPYESDHNVKTIGIVGFTGVVAEALPEVGASQDEQLSAVRVGLCGRVDRGVHADANNRYEQIRIDPELDRPLASIDGREFTMDATLASFFLISKDIQIAGALQVYPFLDPRLRLENREAPWYTWGDRTVATSSIPSFYLGTCANKLGKIWVALPKLLDVNDHNGNPMAAIPEGLYATIRGVVEAALSPVHLTTLGKARDVMRNGVPLENMHNFSVSVEPRDLRTFSAKLQSEAQKTGEAALQVIVIITEMGPFDDTYQYAVGNSNEQHKMFLRLAKLFQAGCTDVHGSNAYVSMDVTIQMEGQTLRLNAKKHIEWLRWIIPTLTQHRAEQIINHRLFILEPPVNVQALAGFLWSPDPARDGAYHDECQFINVQNSDIHLLNDLGFPAVMCSDLLIYRSLDVRHNVGAVCNQLRNMLDRGTMEDSGVHLHVQLPLRLAKIAMSGLSRADFSAWIIPYETVSWG